MEAAQLMVVDSNAGCGKGSGGAALRATLEWLNERLAEQDGGDRSDDSDPSVASGS